MTPSNAPRIDTTTVLLLVLVALFVLPVLVMGLGVGGMMSYGWMMGGGPGSTGGWWPFVGMLVPLVLLLALVGGGYLVLRGVVGETDGRDPSMEELRMAYARGDLTDEEFETRRRKLEESD